MQNMKLGLNLIPIKDFLGIFSPYYLKANNSIRQADIDEFKKSVAKYLKEVEEKSLSKQSEKTIANTALQALFESAGFKAEPKDQEGNSGIDMAIFDENKQVAVIIEAKKSINKKEMISKEDVNKKAFAEAILYYLRERDKLNLSIKFIIITDFYQFFIFSAKIFEIFNKKNNKIKTLYDNWKDNNSSMFDGNTKEFYDEIQKIINDSSFLDSLPQNKIFDNKINAGFFVLEKEKSEDEWFYLYKFFHVNFLLNKFNPNDANVLNKSFYSELLYIIGLCEKKEGKQNIILPSKETLEGKGTLYHNILSNIPSNDKRKNEIFEPALEILIIWLNRILFLKLLEISLSNYNPSKNLKFLNKDKIQDFKMFNNLFFEVLAKKQKERDKEIAKNFNYLPYLNSSLFTKSQKEKIEISELNNLKLEYFKNTQIKNKEGNAQKGEAEWLDYLFEFLEAFDFGEIDENKKQKEFHVSKNEKILINSSVLGLVFEKLNGYKEGSFYTPSFITSYICKKSLEQIVVEKFRIFHDNFKDCKKIEDVSDVIWTNFVGKQEILDEASKIVGSIKICDPSVGSGHFLVSALNEVISIKHRLGILEYDFKKSQEHKKFRITELQVENDEIFLYDQDSKPFSYKKPSNLSDPNHLIQKCLFEQKKSIIENSLFGVDINPSSCEITRLRLWIELLKNTYYLDLDPDYHHLQILPNIDINIKAGNSLISNFPINSTKDSLYKNMIAKINKNVSLTNRSYYEEIINDIQKKFTPEIKKYNEAVKSYKNQTNKDLKSIDKDTIKKSQEFFKELFLRLDPSVIEFRNELLEYACTYGYEGFNIKQESDNLDNDHIKKLENFITEFEFHKTHSSSIPSLGQQNGSDYNALKKLIDLMYRYDNLYSSQSFEWRFEFPEVLDEEGDFVGFDLVIGNPPYIQQGDIKEIKPHLSTHFEIFSGTSDIFTYF
ncbi:DUF7149 domain-containing protein, partial [Helicobacter cappadocius]